MSVFWIVYIVAACTVAGILTLLGRSDLKKGKQVTISLKEGLIGLFLMFCPVLNVAIGLVLIWFYLEEQGDKNIATFGKTQDPK